MLDTLTRHILDALLLSHKMTMVQLCSILKSIPGCSRPNLYKKVDGLMLAGVLLKEKSCIVINPSWVKEYLNLGEKLKKSYNLYHINKF